MRARLQQLAVAHHRRRGYRMLTALLRREGQVVNDKRVLRLMQQDNLLCLRRKGYVFTTDSRHHLLVLSQSDPADRVGEAEPVMGGRHHVYPIAP